MSPSRASSILNCSRTGISLAIRFRLKANLIAALQRQDFARIVGRGDLEPQTLDDPAHLSHLVGVRLGQSTPAEPEAVLEPNADVPAHRSRLRRNRHLAAAGAQNRPPVVVAEEPVGGALHMQHLLRMRADTAQQTEAGLDE